MDDYTYKTKKWLDTRFKKCDENGIYHAHQPIYGFRKGHNDSSVAFKYSITFQIMKALSHIEFNSLLDVGGAEGYKSYIAKQLFGANVTNSDLSIEACKRSGEIFNIKSIPVDIHNLPFNNNEFDVVLCSETLEHVKYLKKAINELMRVAKKALIITVPHESSKAINNNIKHKIMHGHIHCFGLNSFNYLLNNKINIFRKKVYSSYLNIPFALTEAEKRMNNSNSKLNRLLISIYNIFTPVLKIILGRMALTFLIKVDDIISEYSHNYKAIIFTIIKDHKYYNKANLRKVKFNDIIDKKVPYHYLNNINQY